MQRIVLAAAVIVAGLGVLGCGGGGGSTSNNSASGVVPASERLEHTEEGCAYASEEAQANPSDPTWKTTLAKCRAEEKKLRQSIESGEGETTGAGGQ